MAIQGSAINFPIDKREAFLHCYVHLVMGCQLTNRFSGLLLSGIVHHSVSFQYARVSEWPPTTLFVLNFPVVPYNVIRNVFETTFPRNVIIP